MLRAKEFRPEWVVNHLINKNISNMKKLKLFSLGLLGASVMLTSCADDDEDPVGPSFTITEVNTGSTPGNLTITEGDTLVFAWDARSGDGDLERFSVNATGANSPSNIPESAHGHEFPYDIENDESDTYRDTLVFPNGGLTNEGSTVYTFTVRDENGEEATGEFVVNVEADGTPLANEVEGAFFHIGGSLEGAYDLVSDEVKGVNASDDDKDMENTDAAGDPFTGSWAAANTTMFVKDNNFDYETATKEGAADAYNGGSSSASVDDPAQGDVYIANLRGNDEYVVIEIVEVDPDNNDCNCGNTGKITFDYKKE